MRMLRAKPAFSMGPRSQAAACEALPVRHLRWLCVLALGCGDGGAGAGLKSVADAGHSPVPEDAAVAAPEPDAGAPDASAPDANVSAQALRAACQDACQSQAACLELPDSVCAEDCAAQARSLAVECRDEAIGEQRCLAGLSCEDAMAYALSGRRAHRKCGGEAREYFKECTVGKGKTPEGCAALCARYQACDVLDVSVGACEEQCILQATDLETASGPDCSGAFLTFMACGALAECAEVAELASHQLSPVRCEDQLTAMEKACD